MSSTRERRYGLKTLLVALGCLAGAATGVYFLYLDLNATGVGGQGPPIAKVEKRESKVRRKASSSYVWSNVQSNENLYRKDYVSTGPGSAASIRLSDGSLLELGEDSLVIIDDIKNLSLNFVRGSLVVRKSTGDTRISVGKDGKAKVEELPVQLIAPDNLSTFFSPETSAKNIRFTWKPRVNPNAQPGQVDKYVLQVSPDKNFGKGRVQTFDPASAQATEYVAQLRPGKYFWRVVTGSAGLSEPRQFRVIAAAVMKPTWPTAGQKVLAWGEDNPLQFRWSSRQLSDDANESIGDHVIELSKEPGFTTVFLNERVNASSASATIRRIPEGPLYWRIRSQYGDIRVSSPVERFTLEKAKKFAIDQNLPADGTAFEMQPQIRFSWTSPAPDTEYQLEVQSTENNQNKAVQNFRGRAQGYSWIKPGAGIFRWRVLAFNKQNQMVGESPWRAFSVFQGQPIALNSPNNNQQIRFWETPPQFTFDWAREPLVEQEGFIYQMEVATDPTFRNIVSAKKTRTNTLASSDVKLPDGKLFWRIRVIDKSGLSVKQSQVASFGFGVHPPLKAPLEARPQTGEVFNMLELEKDPVASWSEVKEAQGYEVVVYAADSADRQPGSLQQQNKVVLQKVVNETSLELKGLKEGKYFWVVRAIDRIKRRGEPISLKTFTMTYGAPLAAPEALSPEVQ